MLARRRTPTPVGVLALLSCVADGTCQGAVAT
jgi:hypothetical protein